MLAVDYVNRHFSQLLELRPDIGNCIYTEMFCGSFTMPFWLPFFS